jgi:hypothetical protein
MAVRRSVRKKAGHPVPAERGRGARALRPGGGARRRLARGALGTADLHQRFLSSVLKGELRECAWAALKALYFHGPTEKACADKLARWAREHGIGIELEQRRVNDQLVVYLRFKPPA